jgi:hypothetical protein
LVLDHINGVSGDNRPTNLRLLCPNCNSQQPTHGGGNKGKVEQSEGGFAIRDRSGRRNYTLPVEPLELTIQPSRTVRLTVTQASDGQPKDTSEKTLARPGRRHLR